MGIWGFWQTKATEYTHGYLPDDRVHASLNLGKLQRDSTYLTVTLRKMRIENVRSGWKLFHSAVHSDVGALHASGSQTAFRQVISPPELRNTDAKTLSRVIIENQRLFGPAPYRGDPVRLNAALVAVEVADLSGPFLDVLTDLASAAGVAYAAIAKPFLEPIGRGVDLLFGTSGNQGLEIYLVTNLINPRAGVYVVMRASSKEVPLESLTLNADLSLTSDAATDMSKYPYMIITIEADTSRNDWRAIPELNAAFDVFRKALREDQPDESRSTFEHFRRVVLLSDDLHEDHQLAVIAQAKTLWEAVDGGSFTAGGTEINVPGLDVLNPFDKGWKLSTAGSLAMKSELPRLR